MSALIYEHTVGFEETNLVGNVYYTNYLLWQGHCRELFLKRHAPEVVPLIASKEIAFLTRHCSCDYIGDEGYVAMDDVLLRMHLKQFRGGRMTLHFEYARPEQPDELIAEGQQRICCKSWSSGHWAPDVFPPSVIHALLKYADSKPLRDSLHDALEFGQQEQRRQPAFSV